MSLTRKMYNWQTGVQGDCDSPGKKETYVGLTGGTFKERWYKHEGDFKILTTELSIHIWDLKDRNIPYSISWEIVRRARTFSPVTKKCDLCIHEKFEILYNKSLATLNKRNEIFNHCRAGTRKNYILWNGLEEKIGSQGNRYSVEYCNYVFSLLIVSVLWFLMIGAQVLWNLK